MDLTTTYMGIPLRNPLVASASPLSESVENIKRMEEAGAGAVVMFSLFEEQLKREAAALDHYTMAGALSYAEALSYFPEMVDYRVGPEHYLEILSQASRAVDVPVFGSLNGVSREGWVKYARSMEEAGARGIELNVYYVAADMDTAGAEVEQRYVDVLESVKSAVTVPVAMKLSPFFSAMGNMARRLDEAGANALVLFNRFYQPDFDLESLEVVPDLNLSAPHEIRLPLRWIAILHGRIRASLAATTGVHSAAEVIKYIMAGADVTMTTSALLHHGIGYLGELLEAVKRWMEKREYASVEQMKGSMSQRNVGDPSAFERANYIKVLESYRPSPGSR